MMNSAKVFVCYGILVELMLVSTVHQTKRDLFKFQGDKIKFYLWNNNTVEQEISLKNYGTIAKAPTKFLIHGWMDSGTGASFFFYGPIVQKYIKTGANVICVDWSYYSKVEYVYSLQQLRAIADYIARMILGLQERGISINDVHIIGHSLGAQICGFTGKYIQQATNGKKISRITGLDPAGPGFFNAPNTDRLYKTDATHVDTVMSDILMVGIREPLGQVNFYINCGGRTDLGIFNHNLGPFYFEYGILRQDLIGKKCQCKAQKITSCKEESSNILGEHVDFRKPGSYYIDINIKEMMIDAQNAMKTAPKSRQDFDFNIAKDTINLLYEVNSKKPKGLINVLKSLLQIK